ncbi:hypothetical protein DFJ58DRAFT_673424 [Suillus subalutaceus]|uniref:uncharacterized protein n=1 Tax=Suillus subalutaceus TaxID=48586 RepID=UPI001B85DCF6|nr:uncharacterized protein DFJ58DRAFT_673424 [Suillus subalutaceus]KAG1817736.1 hypothetical protein DFJ58DRAFT_673424 [Suillus subalutaceus]
MGRNEEREEKLLERCPPGHEGTKLIDIPATILDASGAIIAWYLPDALTDATQNEIWAASDLLAPMLEQSIKLDGIWRTNQQWFTPSSENDVLTPGCVNLSPAWFQQGHENQSDPEVSASLKGPSSENILKAIARPAAIATAALRVMHPEQYWAGLQAFGASEKRHEARNCRRCQRLSSTGQLVFNSLTVICNRETPNHRDPSSISECFDILTSVGNYSNAWMSMPSLQLELRYDPGCMIAFSGRIVRHAVYAVEGDRIAWAWYMRDAVHVYAGIPSCGWARLDWKSRKVVPVLVPTFK